MELKNYFAQDDQGNIIPEATCYLYQRGTESSAEGLRSVTGQMLPNPFQTDSTGLVQFAAPNGLYDLRVIKGNRDFRLHIQFNDVNDTMDAAAAAASRSEEARDAVMLSKGLANSIAEGLAGTVSGEHFSVLATNSSDYLVLYKNNAGTAVEVKRYPSTEAVNAMATVVARVPKIEKLVATRVPRGKLKILHAVSVGGRLLGYYDQNGIFHSQHSHSEYLGASDLIARQRPKNRPRSRNFKQPFLIASGQSVVGAYGSEDTIVSTRLTAVEATTNAASARVEALERVPNLAPLPHWLARDVTVGSESQIMVHDGQSYRQLTPAGSNWMGSAVGPFNVVRCLGDKGGSVQPYSAWPGGLLHREGSLLLQKLITGQSLSLGSRGFIHNAQGQYVFDVNNGVGDLFSTLIPESMQDYCLSLPGGPRPSGTLDHFIPIREYANGVLGETISTSWAMALRKWSVEASRADLRFLATVHGIGGVAYASLKKGTAIYAQAIAATQAARDIAVARGWKHVVHSISIIHGESQVDTDAATYAGYLAEWVTDLTNDVVAITDQTFAPKAFISQVNTHATNTQEIPLAQLLAHDSNANICLIGPKYQYNYFDQYHLLADGYVKLGEVEARAERFALLGVKWQPLRPLSVRLVGTTLTVQFNNEVAARHETAGPIGALSLDAGAVANPGNYGFVLTDTTASISSVKVGADGHSIVLALSKEPAAGSKLEYAMQLDLGNKPAGGPRGCLRDNDKRDRSRYDGSYLHNWCVAFRKTIEVGS